MAKWTEYSESKKILVTDKISKIIIKEFGELKNDFFLFEGKVRRPQTRIIKDRLSHLGKKSMKEKPSYQVYANGLSEHLRQENGGEFNNKEWLYDLHWYLDGNEPYTTLSLPLVVECEWNSKRKGDSKVQFSGIKYDFQKLLVSNAELRLMIFKIKKVTELEELNCYFMSNIENYEQVEKGAKFLFVAFYDTTKNFYYLEIIK